MEYLMETLTRLNDQRNGILQAAMTQARRSDLNTDELEVLGTDFSQALDDAFFDHTNPLVEELDQRGWAEADMAGFADMVDFQARRR